MATQAPVGIPERLDPERLFREFASKGQKPISFTDLLALGDPEADFGDGDEFLEWLEATRKNG
jgi:hypothetical protein